MGRVSDSRNQTYLHGLNMQKCKIAPGFRQSFQNSRQIGHIAAPIDRQNAIGNIAMKS
jgi:hypothetical protein